MKPPRIIYVALAVLALAVPAAAQQPEPRALPPDEILAILHLAGLDPIGQPKRSGTNYAIRAIDKDDNEVSVEIDANSGDILSKTPAASRTAPASNRAKSRGGTGVGSIIVEENDSPSSRFLRGLAPDAVQSPPPRSSNVTRPRGGPMQPDKDADALLRSKLDIIIDEPGQSSVSPPPERLPRRAAPIVLPELDSPRPVATKPVLPKPDPLKSVSTKPEPLPKPRPDANIDVLPSPPAGSTRRAVGAPVRLTPSLSDAATPPRGGTTTTQAAAPSRPNVIMADPVPDDIAPAPESASRDAQHTPH